MAAHQTFEVIVCKKLEEIASRIAALENGQTSLQRSISLIMPPVLSPTPAIDGPVAPDGFHLEKLYDGFTKYEWRLMACLWGKKTIEEEDVLEAVYGHDHDMKENALRSLRKRLNRKLTKMQFPGEVIPINGHLALNLFKNSAGVKKGS